LISYIWTKDLYVHTTPITQEIYTEVLGKNPSVFQGDEMRPVENISWEEAIDFCNAYSEECQLAPVYFRTKKGVVKWDRKKVGYRLPTLVEWKYLARAGESTKFSGSSSLNKVGWYFDNSGGATASVAQKSPNAFGLYDMSGNVAEWCWDGPEEGKKYALGGSWAQSADECMRSAHGTRYAHVPSSMVGLRVLRNI